METVAFNFHDENGDIVGQFELNAGKKSNHRYIEPVVCVVGCVTENEIKK